jgi:hypothetical protein
VNHANLNDTLFGRNTEFLNVNGKVGSIDTSTLISKPHLRIQEKEK